MKSNPKGNLNVPLGNNLPRVEKQAERIQVSKTELGRMLIVYGIQKMEAGALTFSPPAIADTTSSNG